MRAPRLIDLIARWHIVEQRQRRNVVIQPVRWNFAVAGTACTRPSKDAVANKDVALTHKLRSGISRRCNKHYNKQYNNSTQHKLFLSSRFRNPLSEAPRPPLNKRRI